MIDSVGSGKEREAGCAGTRPLLSSEVNNFISSTTPLSTSTLTRAASSKIKRHHGLGLELRRLNLETCSQAGVIQSWCLLVEKPFFILE